MNKITGIFIVIFAIVLSASLYSQESNTENANNGTEIKILTSAVCEMCKDRIEETMKDVKGVNSSSLDVESKILTVNYDSAVITPEEIRKAITKIGYDADDMLASKKAYAKLPKCCQKNGHN